MDNKEIEFLDLEEKLEKINEVELKSELEEKEDIKLSSKKTINEKAEPIKEEKIIKKKRVVKGSSFLIMLLTILLIMTCFISVQYFCGLDLFKIYDNNKTSLNITNIKEAYTNSKNGRNLTFYDDETFKYMDNSKVVEGTYKIEKNKYTLIYDKSICELTKNNNIISSTCPLIMTTEDNDYMTFKNKQITKILYNVDSDEYDKISKAFLTYINGLPTTKKYPTLKSSRVDSLSDCFSINNMKTLTCSVNYTIIPNETDLTKSKWLEKGEVVKGAIKKFHYVTFTNTNNNYKFSSMTLNI